MRKLSLGELTAHVSGGPDGNGGGDGPVVVLLHGFGAPGTDLVPIGSELAVGPDVRFVFPMAPNALEQGPESYVRRAWWMIDIAALELAVLKRSYAAIASSEPAGLAQARRAVESLLDAIDAELGRAPIFLGGFSQGAMLSTDLVLRSERAFAGLIILSGALIAEREWSARAPRRAGLPVFQSHGSSDPILPYPLAEMLRDQLLAAGLSVSWNAFAGGHGIPRDVLRALSRFIVENRGGTP